MNLAMNGGNVNGLASDGSANGLGSANIRSVAQRVLVAEDDEDTREMVVSALIDEGHEVVGVEDGTQLTECLEIIARESLRLPDLIALDIHMPGPSGLELLEGLRRSGWQTPVVIMTAFMSREALARVEMAGAAAIIEKPFNRLELRAAVLSARGRKAAVKGISQ